MFKFCVLSLIALHFVLHFTDGEVITFENCEDSQDSICQVKEVRVNPCKEAKNNKPCKFRSGTNSTIEFDYIINFDSNDLVTQAYSASFVDLPLIGMDRDGCKFTTCPTKTGEERTYKNILYISPAFPLLKYNVKWRLWDAADSSKGCCFIFKIALVR